MTRFSVLSILVIVLLLICPPPGRAEGDVCSNNSTFVDDVTVPDGAPFGPGESFVKIWRVRNTGACDWASGFTLDWVRGDSMGLVTSQAFGKPVPAGQMAEIAVEMTAPPKIGRAVSWWKIKDESGQAFGDELYVEVEVRSPTPTATLVASPTATPDAPFGAFPEPATQRPVKNQPVRPTGRIVHFELYLTDGYVNLKGGTWPPEHDATTLAGWPAPLYVWGLTDHDPNLKENVSQVPAGAQATAGSAVGNAKLPSPFVEVTSGDDVYVTVHNRGFLQEKQSLQDDVFFRLHGVQAQPQYDGFPGTAGGYEENLRHFWQEAWYLALGPDSSARDSRWNAMSIREQQALLAGNTALIKKNGLSPSGGVRSPFDKVPWPDGVTELPTELNLEDVTQFTYYFRAGNPGPYLYESAVANQANAGTSGVIVVRPPDFNPTHKTVYGSGTNSDYDREYVFLLSEIDPEWHQAVEAGDAANRDPQDFRPGIWLINGRSFPMTLAPFAWNGADGTPDSEPRYDTHVQVKPGERFLVRYVNAGVAPHSIRQHGWSMQVVGSDRVARGELRRQWTLTIDPGETYDAITLADPVYGVDEVVGSPLGDRRPWRQIWPVHELNDRRVMTGRNYPGGMLTYIEVIGIPGVPENMPTWLNPYLAQPGMEILPRAELDGQVLADSAAADSASP